MAQRKYIRITSATQRDVTEMFNAFCEQIAMKSPLEIKKSLGFKGPDAQIEVADVNVQDLIDLFHEYDVQINFSLRAEWTDYTVEDKKKEEPEKRLCDVHRDLMNKEKSEITNTDLSDIVKKETPVPPVFTKIEENKSGINPANVPDFNL